MITALPQLLWMIACYLLTEMKVCKGAAAGPDWPKSRCIEEIGRAHV